MSLLTKDIFVKHSLGRIILYLLCFTLLQAEDFSYGITASKTKAYLHEPLLLTVDLNQTNPDVVLLFQFDIDKDPDYQVTPLFARNDDTLHHTKHHNVFQLYPLKTGDITVHFTLLKRITNDEKVRYFASGDRDDFKKLDTNDFPVALPPLKLHIKPLPKGTQLVGDFHLDYSVNTHHAKMDEPVSVKITLKGKGYPPHLKHLIPQSKAYTLFSEKPRTATSSGKKGIAIQTTYLFALSAKNSFTLPEIKLHAFDPDKEKSYILTLPKQHFDIQPVDKKSLVDKRNIPPLLQTNLVWLKNLFGYLMAFAAGYFTARLFKLPKRSAKKTKHPLEEKIQNTKDAKTLLQLLMATDSKKFASSIENLEKHLYGDGTMNLKKIKQDILEKI